jgi:hypothetical protein
MIPPLKRPADFELDSNIPPKKPKISPQSEAITVVSKNSLKNLTEGYDSSDDSEFCYSVSLESESISLDCEESMESDSDNSISDSEDLFFSIPDDWREALNDLLDIEMDEKPIMQMLSSNSVKFLNAEEKEIIFDAILNSENKSVIAESILLNLPLECRNILLKKALKLNDLQMTKAAIFGCKGQKLLDFDEWTANQSLYCFLKYKIEGIDREIMLLLLSISEIDEEDIEQLYQEKFVFNIWGLEDTSVKIKNEIVEYEGGFTKDFSEKIAEYFKFCNERNFLDTKLCADLCEQFENATKTAHEKFKAYSSTLYKFREKRVCEINARTAASLLILDKQCKFSSSLKNITA